MKNNQFINTQGKGGHTIVIQLSNNDQALVKQPSLHHLTPNRTTIFCNFKGVQSHALNSELLKTYSNKKTRITASVIGVLLGLSGIINHGIFEILRGNNPTNGFFIDAIGEAHKFWIHGTEAAITIIPNFLITGICAVVVGLAIIIWSLKYLQKKNGLIIFLALLILLTLVGGGVGHILLFVPTWAFATQIDRSLNFWNQEIPERMINTFSRLWIYGLIATSACWLILMELGIFGYFPGVNNPDTLLNIVFVFLFSSVFFACITFVCAFAADLEARKSN